MNLRKNKAKNLNKRQNKGITLIALIITIIILLVLTVVSINALTGDNGIITNAEKTKESAEEARIREELENVMLRYNASEYVTEADGLARYLINAKENGSIGNFVASTDGDIVILEKEGKYYQLDRENNGENTYKILYREVDDNIKHVLEEEAKLQSEGDVSSSIIVTQKTLDENDDFSFVNGQKYIIIQKLSGDNFEFNIPAGDPITIKIAYDMDIDNRNAEGRSAINLESGTDSNGKHATLNLYVYGNVNVNSSFSKVGASAVGEYNLEDTIGKPGGCAGIHVPEGATLNIYGGGTLTAIGGNAANGSEAGFNTLDWGGTGGGRSWSWNRWQRWTRRRRLWSSIWWPGTRRRKCRKHKYL